MNTSVKLREAQKNYEEKESHYKAATAAERVAFEALVKARTNWMNEKNIMENS